MLTFYMVKESEAQLLLRATRSEAERGGVDSFFSQSYGTFEQRNILKSNDFSDKTQGTKMFIFYHIIDIRDELAQPCPAQPSLIQAV